MKLSALDYLRCIHCANPVVLEPAYVTANNSDEVMSGKLECQGCHKIYAITNGIPRMVDAAISTAADVISGDVFAHAWRAFPRIDNSYFQQFFDWINPVDPQFVQDKIVLDAGCGKGRHVNVMVQAGAKVVLAVDIGGAIDVAYENVGHLPNVHIVQGDVANLPFAPVADFAFSLGVLDHMESPADGLASMSSKLNENGCAAIWVYGRENNGWIITFVNPLRTAITSKLPSAAAQVVSGLMAMPVFAYSHFIANPWKNLQKTVPLPDVFYQDYMVYISSFDFTETHHIAHDHIVAPLANYSTKEEVASWFERAGLPDPLLRWHNKNSWAGFSSKSPEIRELMRKRAQQQLTAKTASENP